MPRLADRAVGTIGALAPKAVDLLSTTGFAAAGVVSVVAENLRTLADRDEALPDRAKQVAQNSIGAVLAGPKALSDRGRSLVGADGAGAAASTGNGARAATATTPTRAHEAGDTSGTKTTAKTVSPAERPDRSKAEEARDRDVAAPEAERVTAEDRAKAPEKTAKKGPEKTPERPAKRSPEKTAKKAPEKTEKAAKKKAEKRPAAETAEKRPVAETGDSGQDRPRSVEEKRAAEKTAKKQAQQEQAKTAGTNGQKGEHDQEVPDGVPAGVDEQLVADLQTMTVKQLRDRAAQDGVPGRSGMSKDELVVALATRETDDVPAKR